MPPLADNNRSPAAHAMTTAILSLFSPQARETALTLLRADGVIVAATDTVFGVMCRYDSELAVQELFRVKQRPRDKAIAILIGDREQLSLVAQVPIPPLAEELAARFWPGPLTLILPARDGLPDALTASGASVGVRMPNHAALCELMRASGPLAATSANLSGSAETHTAHQARDQLDGLVPLILDDAPRRHAPSPASTVVDLCGLQPAIVRPGPIADEVQVVLDGAGHTSC